MTGWDNHHYLDRPLFPDTVMGRWDRPWHLRPPVDGESCRLFMCACPARPDAEECTPEALVDLLRGMVDTGQLQPDDIIRDIVLFPANRRWAVRGWRRRA